jgi:hypothetical protein
MIVQGRKNTMEKTCPVMASNEEMINSFCPIPIWVHGRDNVDVVFNKDGQWLNCI